MNSLIELSSVALVKIDAGAEFSSLQTASEAIRLYIDLNQGQVGDEDNLNILGFQLRNIFFITNTQRIRMQEVRKLIQDIYIHSFLKSITDNIKSCDIVRIFHWQLHEQVRWIELYFAVLDILLKFVFGL